MKVIHYIVSLGFGGIERLVYDLVTEQKKNSEVNPSIAIAKLKGEFKAEFEGLNIPLFDLKLNSGFDINPFKIRRIYRLFKKQEVIHLHGFHLSVAIAAIWSKRRIIYTEHGNFGFGRKHSLSDKLSFWLRRQFFKNKSVSICCNSKFTEGYLRTHFYKGNSVKTVYNGVLLDRKVNTTMVNDLKEEYSGKFVVGTSTRLAGFKRIDRLIDVFATFQKTHQNAVLIIVGDGPEKENLIQQTKDLNIEDSVVFKGFQQEVASFQSAFDVAVFPSQNEPFGLVAVECLKLQKPVLVFNDGGGICEIIEMFYPNDICDHKTAMVNRLLFYSEKKFEWDEENDEKLKYFAAERMEKAYFNEYKEVL